VSFFPDEMPRPEPDRDDQGFWEACAQRRLCFQACGACGALRHPPRPICYRCHSVETKWVEAPSPAVVYTFCVVHHPNHPAVASRVPYVVGVVEFPSLPGVRLVTNITDIAHSTVRIGMPVSIWWDDIGGGMFVPRFRPAAPSDA
jgi:uncharacterized OB-fold protein